jgi:histidinol-phosphate aminotransferase
LIAAEAALADDAFVARSRELNRQGLDRLSHGLGELGLRSIPSIGNFVLVDLGRSSGSICESLLREGIITRPVANYGLPNHLRITVGLPEQNERVLAALGRIMGLE